MCDSSRTAVTRYVLALITALGMAQGDLAGQADSWSGSWAARGQDRGVTVSLTLGTSERLVIPGIGPGGRVAALSLAIRDLRRDGDRVTFVVDLPDNEGTLEFEVHRGPGAEDLLLRVLRVDGEPADDDMPTWTLARQR